MREARLPTAFMKEDSFDDKVSGDSERQESEGESEDGNPEQIGKKGGRPNSTIVEAKSSPGRSDKKHFICPTCKKNFKGRQNLETHARIHKNERPFQCFYAVCGKRFRTKGNMQDHARRHYEEK